MTDQEHANAIEAARQALNKAVWAAVLDDFNVTCEVLIQNTMHGECPEVTCIVQKVILPGESA